MLDLLKRTSMTTLVETAGYITPDIMCGKLAIKFTGEFLALAQSGAGLDTVRKCIDVFS